MQMGFASEMMQVFYSKCSKTAQRVAGCLPDKAFCHYIVSISDPACNLVHRIYAAWCRTVMHAFLVPCHATEHTHDDRLDMLLIVSGRSSTCLPGPLEKL